MMRIQQTRSMPLALGIALMAMASTSLGNIVDDDHLALSGSGIFPESRPSNCKPLPKEIFKTDQVEGPIPTNDWWSSLAWTEHSAPMFAHPLVLRATPQGLSVTYPGPSIVASERAIVGGAADGDLILSDATTIRSQKPALANTPIGSSKQSFKTQPECSEQALAMAAHSSMSSMKTFDRKLLLPSARSCGRRVQTERVSEFQFEAERMGSLGRLDQHGPRMRRGMSNWIQKRTFTPLLSCQMRIPARSICSGRAPTVTWLEPTCTTPEMSGQSTRRSLSQPKRWKVTPGKRCTPCTRTSGSIWYRSVAKPD